jgi:hypothetical protein
MNVCVALWKRIDPVFSAPEIEDSRWTETLGLASISGALTRVEPRNRLVATENSVIAEIVALVTWRS